MENGPRIRKNARAARRRRTSISGEVLLEPVIGYGSVLKDGTSMDPSIERNP